MAIIFPILILKVVSVYCKFSIKDFNFIDDWDYQTQPSQSPLLKSGATIHTLGTHNKETEEIPNNCLQNQESNEAGIFGHLGEIFKGTISCLACAFGVGSLQALAKNSVPIPVIKTKFMPLCVLFAKQTDEVCHKIFDTFAPDVIPVLQVTTLGAKQICTLVLGESCGKGNIPGHNWKVSIPKHSKSKQVDLSSNINLRNPTLKVLQISDTHLDPHYLEGSIANCREPLCCRKSSSPPKQNAARRLAGKWGSYNNCDPPKILMENMLSNIIQKHPDIDYVIWTGDIPPHDIWNQTKQQSLELLRDAVEQMFLAFPNIPVFPALGNHEGIPAGNFPPPWNKFKQFSITWLYEEARKQWRKWLPETEDVTILHGGFYSVVLRPGLRLISLNTNYCHTLSWWLFVNSTDPARELQWLVYQLQQAEDNGEKVHIIGHIPPGVSDCLKTWSENYYAIVNRFKNTITGQFFGHQHTDEFEVFYDDARATSVAYLGPSVTPYDGQSPAFRIYYIDGEHKDTTWEVVDHETWMFDLDRANREKQENPEWFLLYSAKESYNLTSLRPTAWADLIERMERNNTIFDQFYRFYYRNSPTTPSYTIKDKLQILCNLKSGKSQDQRHLCKDLDTKINN